VLHVGGGEALERPDRWRHGRERDAGVRGDERVDADARADQEEHQRRGELVAGVADG